MTHERLFVRGICAMEKRFDFQPQLIASLKDIDSLPMTEPNAVPGIPGRLFIVAPEQKEQLEYLIRVLDAVSSEELETWTDTEKLYWSGILNNADTVVRNCITRPLRT